MNKRYHFWSNRTKIFLVLIISLIIIYILRHYIDKDLLYSVLMYYMYEIFLHNNLFNKNINNDIDIFIERLFNKNSMSYEEFKNNTNIWGKFKLKLKSTYNTEFYKWKLRINTLRWIFGRRNN